MIDVKRRMDGAVARASVLAVLGLAVAAAWMPWQACLLLAAGVVAYCSGGIGMGLTGRFSTLLAGHVAGQAFVAVGFTMADRQPQCAPLLGVALLAMACVTSVRLSAFCSAWACAVYSVTAIVASAGHPDIVGLAAALTAFGATTILATATRAASIADRSSLLTDPLTKLANRAGLSSYCLRLAELSTASVGHGVIVIDMDHFKAVNDVHGHGVGDEVLVGAAQLLQAVVDGRGTAFRLGGEEFVAIVPLCDAAGCALVAERIRSVIADAPIAGLPISASLGFAASAPGDAFDYNSVFQEADQALYVAKRNGRDQVAGHTPAGAYSSALSRRAV